ncbi:hypothetical protein F4775DRAFT_586359 [Biscogniauxia sp. FL1348]|nr:hypothetical protein F4775DRAFT_586359 [Biscogniauxia sp. FL1348]
MEFLVDKVQQARSRNSELLGILSQTDHAKPAIAQQNQYADDLDKAIVDLRKRIQYVCKQRVKQLKNHKKYRDPVMMRFAYRVSGKTGKFAAKAEKEESKYLGEEKKLEVMHTEAMRAQNDLEAVVARHNKAKCDLGSLYDSVFQGPTPGFPEEDLSERNAERALQVYHEARTTMEILRVGQMMTLVSQAQRISPHVQSLLLVHIAEDSLVMDVFFDNILSDMDFHKKIKDSKASLQRCGRDLAEQTDNAQARYQAYKLEMNLNSDALQSARLELQRTRERVFERIISSQGGEKGHAKEYTDKSGNPPPDALG